VLRTWRAREQYQKVDGHAVINVDDSKRVGSDLERDRQRDTQQLRIHEGMEGLFAAVLLQEIGLALERLLPSAGSDGGAEETGRIERELVVLVDLLPIQLHPVDCIAPRYSTGSSSTVNFAISPSCVVSPGATRPTPARRPASSGVRTSAGAASPAARPPFATASCDSSRGAPLSARRLRPRSSSCRGRTLLTGVQMRCMRYMVVLVLAVIAD
jgi:hypothetical protein